MKIKDIKTFVVGNPPPSFGGRYFVFIKLITDNGIEGLGEVYNLPFHPDIVAQMVKDHRAMEVLRKNPDAVNRITGNSGVTKDHPFVWWSDDGETWEGYSDPADAILALEDKK